MKGSPRHGSGVSSPYVGLSPRAYWRSGVVDRHPLDLGDVYVKKFEIRPGEKIATAGSCFAQHISKRLRAQGYDVLDVEPSPPALDERAAASFGFGLYSARYGNIYTTRQLRQLAEECIDRRRPAEVVWERDGRFYDAIRPSVEPKGLASPEQVHAHRRQHLDLVRWLLQSTSLFIFTFGLTETWEHLGDGTVYPTAPGTIAGSFDPSRYGFRNLTYNEVVEDFLAFRSLLQSFNPNVRFLLTVSPVPLTATAGNEHVLPATVYSKSVLRAVAGYLAASLADVDYFPSYELVSGTPARGFFYESNLRSVTPAGVDIVMRAFFSQHARPDAVVKADPVGESAATAESSDLLAAEKAMQQAGKVYCEEQILEMFAP